MKNKDNNSGIISAYLKGDDSLLLEAIKEEINHQRRVDCDNHYKLTGFHKKYTPIGNSELISQLLKRFKDTSKSIFIEKLDYHCRQVEYYRERLQKINNIRKDEIFNGVNLQIIEELE